MRNHEYRNGQLIQTNKRFADLKQKQKEWINNQLKEKYIENYKETAYGFLLGRWINILVVRLTLI
jgi:hypothetical protein